MSKDQRNKIKAGVIQWDIRPGKISENLSVALRGIKKLALQKCDLAVLPEMWSCGFDNTNLKIHAEKTTDILQCLQQSAVKQHIVIAGSLPEKMDRSIYNTLFIIDKDGHIAGRYRKIHLFSLTQEHKYFAAGKRAIVCHTSIGNLGCLICYDVRFPELSRTLALKGAQLLLLSAQWPIGRIRQWDLLIRARAVENQLFIVAANRSGQDPGISYGGHSGIFSPGGDALVVCLEKQDGGGLSVLSGEIDLEEVETFRRLIPCFKERVPQAYGI
jgi:predicted amidohydrolase